MNTKMILAILMFGFGMGVAQAADGTPKTNTTTIAASALISPGNYTATIVPGFNGDMATRLEKEVGQVPGLETVSSHAEDSSLHFTVKNGAKVRLSDIQKAVVKADAGAVMSTPILEHSLTANPGL